MRFLLALIIFIMALTIIVFAINNVGTTVPVTLISTHSNLQLIVIVFSAIAFGSIFVGIVAVTEGAKTRFENRRLRREVRKLETELNFLRTQPRSGTSDEGQERKARVGTLPAQGAAAQEEPPSAPVYQPRDEDDPSDDPEDDIYAGERAV